MVDDADASKELQAGPGVSWRRAWRAECARTAMAMAMSVSVTVSMGEEMKGVLRVILRVIRASKTTWIPTISFGRGGSFAGSVRLTPRSRCVQEEAGSHCTSIHRICDQGRVNILVCHHTYRLGFGWAYLVESISSFKLSPSGRLYEARCWRAEDGLMVPTPPAEARTMPLAPPWCEDELEWPLTGGMLSVMTTCAPGRLQLAARK